jgi:hypothetical protein
MSHVEGERGLRVFEGRMLMKKFGSDREEVL